MSLEKIKKELKAGARPNKYRIKVQNPAGGPSEEQLDILCKATSIPEATVGVIEVYNQGRKLPIAGDKSYGSAWDITFYNTQKLDIRNAFEDWMKKIDDVQTHNREWEFNNEYMKDFQVAQLNGKDEIMSEYTLYNCWPSNITAVDLADDSQDTVSEFTVTITFSHWEKKS